MSESSEDHSSELKVEDQPSEFKVFGFEMLDREVRQSGNTGRVYLPRDWIGSRVKIIRVSKKKRNDQNKEKK
ncbi:MAG: DUF2080 family transposase-associated protein [Promethearchaeota archaeon]